MKKIKVISLFLVFAFVICNFQYVLAQRSESDITDDSNLDYELLTDLIPGFDPIKMGHKARDRRLESSLNEITMLNNDNSYTSYWFGDAVKYYDEDTGLIIDKSNKLEKSIIEGYAWENPYNTIKTRFPNNILEMPIVTTANNYTISTRVNQKNNSRFIVSPIKENDNSLSYIGAFGDNTSINYTVKYDGYKEDIILDSIDTPSTFSFEIECEGLILEQQGEDILFKDINDGESIFAILPLCVYDSSEEPNYCDNANYSIKRDNNKYIITISIDKCFVTSSNIVFPIHVDPTIQYIGDSYISDAPIYSGTPSSNYGSTTIGYMGKHPTTSYGIGRFLIKFNGAFDFLNSRNQDEIIKASLNIYNYAYGSYTSSITAYQFSGNIWTEANATWNSVSPNSLGTLQFSQGLTSTFSGYFPFTVTSAVKSWCGTSSTATSKRRRGLILVNGNESNSSYAKRLYSSEASESYRPYLTISYTLTLNESDYTSNVYYIKNAGSGLLMSVEGPSTAEGAAIEQWQFDASEKTKWIIERRNDGHNTYNGYYNIYSKYCNDLGYSRYIGVENNSSEYNAAIKQYSSNNGGGRNFTFTQSSSENYIIWPMTGAHNNQCVSAPLYGNSSGVDLIQYGYFDNIYYTDEWRIALVGSIKDCHYSTPTVSIRWITAEENDPYWRNLANTSAASWGNALPGVNITITDNTNNNNTIQVESIDENYFGLTQSWCDPSTHCITHFDVYINLNTLGDKIDNYRRSTITHEFGHVLGLKDDPPIMDHNDSLMHHNRNRNTVFVPTVFDVQNVRFVYTTLD